MKHLITLAAVACAFASHAAYMQYLHNGVNTVDQFGEIVAIEANTISGSQAVTASVSTVVNEYTNRYQSVTSPHTVYSFTITNFDGNASIATNTWDSFRYSDWTTDAGKSKIVGPVKQYGTNVTEQVKVGSALKASYNHSVSIGNGTAEDHYLKITPASTTYFMGGFINLECGDADSVRILIK